MRYKSTRNSELRQEASEVIVKGISEEGGLFLPESIPDLSNELEDLAKLDYLSLAKRILALYLTDFTEEEISRCVDAAYTGGKFERDEPVQIKELGNSGTYMLELWHGPTCAFKDMALQLLPHLLTTALQKQNQAKKALILVATSGDTGKAALEGFRDVKDTEVIVFYPEDGVSPMQKLQMNTQEGDNVCVCAVKGNFDDTQTGIKTIFTDTEIKQQLYDNGYFFSSANSINWGRLLPQIVYYVYSYLELYRIGKVKNFTDPVNFIVPTGNFGNILAAFYAGRMGLPIHKLICASNANNVLADFISTGVYDKRREFYATASPSMDILVSSNLERLIYMLSGEDSAVLSEWMTGLSTEGQYKVDDETKSRIQALFYGDFCTDEETKQVIRNTYRDRGYLSDTHTAVALGVYDKYLEKTGDETPAVVVSTASPYKFARHVLGSLTDAVPQGEFDIVTGLEELTREVPQKQITDLKGKKQLFDTVIEKDEMSAFVKKQLARLKDHR